MREAVGLEIELLVECHGRLAPSDAIRIGGTMEQYRPFCLEEPVPPENMDAMQRVAEAINIPIATGIRLMCSFNHLWKHEQQYYEHTCALFLQDYRLFDGSLPAFSQ